MLKKLKTFLQKTPLQMCVQKDYDEVMEQAIVVRKKYVDGAKDEIKHLRDWPKIYAYVLVIGAGGENAT